MDNTKVLILNHFGTNKGDAAILIGTISALQHVMPDIRIAVESSDPDITYLRTRGKAKIVERVVERKENSNTLKWTAKIAIWILQSMIWGFMRRYNVDIKRLFCSKKFILLSEYETADIIISGGGGYIRDNSGLAGYLPLYSILLAHLIKKPVVIYAQSIGPLNGKFYKIMTRLVLNRAKLITLRDVVSREVIANLGVSDPQIYITSDAAFYFHPDVDFEKGQKILKDEFITDMNKKMVGVTLMRWHYPGYSSPMIKQENYKQTMANVLDYVIEKYNSNIIFISMNTDKQREDEISLAKEIISKMENKANTNLVIGEYSPEELKDIISQLDLLIGTRFHSLIFASTVGIPIVSIMYEHKALGIMMMLNLEDYVCDIHELQEEELKSKIDEAMKNADEIKSEMKLKTKLLQDLAIINAKLLCQMKISLGAKEYKLSYEDVRSLDKFNLGTLTK